MVIARKNFERSRVLINASNLRVGGGVQVAVSFLYELAKIPKGDLDFDYDVIASSSVVKELKSLGVDLTLINVSEFNTYGLKAFFSGITTKLKNYDLVFTIFGPGYFFRGATKHILGFAQAWIIYPDNEFWLQQSIQNKISLRLKFWLQIFFLKNVDHFVVELDHVKSGLIQRGISSSEHISVIPNCVSSIYFNPSLYEPIKYDFSVNKDKILIGLVSRDYPHKNIDILPKVGKTLKERFNLDVKFVLTLSEIEWNSKSEEFKQWAITVGSISSAQCPIFYKNIDAVIFPSYLESFSITPFEALVMKKPLFASDRAFVRDSCGKYAYYFDPSNPSSICEVIAGYFLNDIEKYSLEDGYKHVINYSDPKSRTIDYIGIIKDLLK